MKKLFKVLKTGTGVVKFLRKKKDYSNLSKGWNDG